MSNNTKITLNDIKILLEKFKILEFRYFNKKSILYNDDVDHVVSAINTVLSDPIKSESYRINKALEYIQMCYDSSDHAMRNFATAMTFGLKYGDIIDLANEDDRESMREAFHNIELRYKRSTAPDYTPIVEANNKLTALHQAIFDARSMFGTDSTIRRLCRIFIILFDNGWYKMIEAMMIALKDSGATEKLFYDTILRFYHTNLYNIERRVNHVRD